MSISSLPIWSFMVLFHITFGLSDFLFQMKSNSCCSFGLVIFVFVCHCLMSHIRSCHFIRTFCQRHFRKNCEVYSFNSLVNTDPTDPILSSPPSPPPPTKFYCGEEQKKPAVQVICEVEAGLIMWQS